MVLRNKTTGKIITNEIIHAKSLWSQAIGLMFHKKANLIMYFNQERKISLHNFFVFYPLEIIILNQHKQVIEIKPAFKPFTFYTANNKGFYCIELGINQSKDQCNIADQLEF